MIAQIAMKNYLRSISKRLFELPLYDNIADQFDIDIDFYQQRQFANYLDLKEYISGFNRAKKIIEKGWDNEYYLFYYEKLNYVVPIAFQGNISLLADFEGNIINDIYNTDPKYHTKGIHICIFPLAEYSIVMMFIDSKDKRYRRFYKQFAKLSHTEKLATINYVIFCYSEDIFINKGINKEVINNKKLIEASQKSTIAITIDPMLNPINTVIKNFDLSKMNEIPNLLLDKYKIR